MRNQVRERMLACLLALFLCLGSGMPHVVAVESKSLPNTSETSTEAEPGETSVRDETLNEDDGLDDILNSDEIMYGASVGTNGVGGEETGFNLAVLYKNVAASGSCEWNKR